MLAERSKLQWDTYLAARRAQATPFGDRDELHRFVIGVHLRGEQATVAEMRELLDQASPDTTERDAIASFLEDGFGPAGVLRTHRRLRGRGLRRQRRGVRGLIRHG